MKVSGYLSTERFVYLRSIVVESETATEEIFLQLLHLVAGDISVVCKTFIAACHDKGEWPTKVLKSGTRKPLGRNEASKLAKDTVQGANGVLANRLATMASQWLKEEKLALKQAEQEQEQEQEQAELTPLQSARSQAQTAEQLATSMVRELLKPDVTTTQRAFLDKIARNDSQRLAFLLG